MFSGISTVFRAVKPPRSGPSETALRLRSLPEGGPPLGENFSELLVKINDFLMEMTLFCDIYLCIFDHIRMTTMKYSKIKNIFQKYVGSHHTCMETGPKNDRKRKISRKILDENWKK